MCIRDRVLAVDNYPYFDPKDTGYGITNDDKPWFDGKDYPYYRDMYDGKNLKPMEEGSYEKFPENWVLEASFYLNFPSFSSPFSSFVCRVDGGFVCSLMVSRMVSSW